MMLLENLTAPGGGRPRTSTRATTSSSTSSMFDSGRGRAVDDDDIPRTMLGAPRYGLAAV